MKKVLTAMAISVSVMLVALPLASGQERTAPAPTAPPAQDRPATPAPGAQTQAEQVFQGQLTKVDANAKSISLKGTGDREMTFDYTDSTQVMGSEKNVQGLAGKTGTELKVTYREAGGKRTATKIETVEKR